jgi:ribosomal protein L5
MNLVKNHYISILTQDYLNKYNTKRTKLLPRLDKVVLSTKFNTNSKAAVVILIEMVSFYKPYITQSKVNSLSLNLRKGDLVGAKVILKKKAAFEFLQTFLFEILPYTRKFEKGPQDGITLHYQIKDIFILESTNVIFDYLRNVRTLDLAIKIHNLPNLRFPIEF